MLVLLIPLAYSISIRELLSRYSFSTSTLQMNVTGFNDFMADSDNNGINDTLILEIATSNSNGNFIFAANLNDRYGILTNETNRTLSAGTNKVNLTFSTVLFSQNQFNYSIKAYNSSHSLKYRKDSILTKEYQNYEKGFSILDIKDSKIGNSLRINITLNSTINGTFSTAIFLSYNKSILAIKENKSITDSVQKLIFEIGNETVKKTHYSGKFSITSIKIGEKTIKTDFLTSSYDYRDFAATSYFGGFSDYGLKSNSDKFNDLVINSTINSFDGNNYEISFALYDLYGNIIQRKNVSAALNFGANYVPLPGGGELYENGKLIDRLNDAYKTGAYSFNDFESRNLPDIAINISVSDDYHYGINNATINVTFRNKGSSNALNILTEVFDNRTFSSINRTNIIKSNMEMARQFRFVNFTDFEFSAFADTGDSIEESNESNNAGKVFIKLNKNPVLDSPANITVNESERIKINLSGNDANGDALSYSVNSSKFTGRINIFEWNTTTADSGNYNLKAEASDGYLADFKIFNIAIIDNPELDFDNDGVNDSVDKLIGSKDSINSTTLNLTVFVNNSSDLNRIINENAVVKINDNNLTIAEFEFNFSKHLLNLTNVSINKQAANKTGSLVFFGLRLPSGATKSLYLDRINQTNGICIMDEDILSLAQISANCDFVNEYRIECDGTLQKGYSCAYNSTLNKYKVTGLRHSGIVQLDYSKPSSASSGSTSLSGSDSGSSGGGGGGSGITCSSSWKCSEWSKCENGVMARKCSDANQCSVPTKKPEEAKNCLGEKENLKDSGMVSKSTNKSNPIEKANNKINEKTNGVTGLSVFDRFNLGTGNWLIDSAAVILVLGIIIFAARRIFSKNL